MGMKILAFNGWAQPHDGLSALVPGTTPIFYSNHPQLSLLWENLHDNHRDAEAVIGWSLGAQLAVRAASEGIIAPKKMLLIAPPYQFVADRHFPHAMPADIYEVFLKNYLHANTHTVNKFTRLIAKGDANAAFIEGMLKANEEGNHVSRWLPWLEEIGGFSAASLTNPPAADILLLHGGRDVIVNPESSARYAAWLPNARYEIFEAAGHAPHLHDTERFRRLVKEFLST